ncbi:MAG: response regulator [Candidatus Sedimenticola sp. PURPLELP]
MERLRFSRFFNRSDDTTSEGERRRNKRTIPEEGTQVLVVDDSRTAQRYLSAMLNQGRFDTMVAEDGETGINLAKIAHPDLILMDVFMPGINGFQATRKLREDPETHDIPIIMISGNSEGMDHIWGLKMGANDFIAKPFTRGQLFQRIENLLYRNSVRIA